MRKIKIKARAKVNFTLDVSGKKDGYHELKTLVASVSLSDDVIIKKRKDDLISLKVIGRAGCSAGENNAFKAGKLFKKTFNTKGFDIVLKKRIPIGSGLGGSSADAAGVLSGLKTLFGLSDDMTALANALGSDTAYMLRGGFAVLEGRGEKITPIESKEKFYFLLLKADGSVITKDAYSKFDETGVSEPEKTPKAADALKNGDISEFLGSLKNDLYNPATAILPEIEENLETLSSVAPSVMSGSGATTFAVFTDEKSRDLAYKFLKKQLKGKLIKAETV